MYSTYTTHYHRSLSPLRKPRRERRDLVVQPTGQRRTSNKKKGMNIHLAQHHRLLMFRVSILDVTTQSNMLIYICHVSHMMYVCMYVMIPVIC